MCEIYAAVAVDYSGTCTLGVSHMLFWGPTKNVS